MKTIPTVTSVLRNKLNVSGPTIGKKSRLRLDTMVGAATNLVIDWCSRFEKLTLNSGGLNYLEETAT